MQALVAELSRPEYAGLSHEQAAATVNAKRVSVRKPVPTWAVRQAAIEAGYWAALVEARESPSPELRRLALNTLAWVDDQSGVIQLVDMDRPAVVALRAALVAAAVCSQQQADALSALADASVPWTQSAGLPEVGIGLVINARRQIGA
jgi:hypothetical protein